MEASEPDPYITDLNAEIGKCDDFASTTLPDAAKQLVTINWPTCARIDHLSLQICFRRSRSSYGAAADIQREIYP